MSNRVRCSGTEPGQRPLAGIQTTGRDYRNLSQPQHAIRREDSVAVAMRDGTRLLADLHRPFFAVSTNLTSGKLEVHRRGLMRQAMRASIAIPGILPPVVIDGQVLVDGAVLKNLPAEVMRNMNSGPVIGIDMSETRGVDPDTIQHPPSIWRLIATGAWRRGPPIVSILMRSATLTTDADLESSRAATDLLIQPTPDGVDIRDWKAFEPGVEAGYRATREALDGLDRPVTRLRRRNPLSAVAPSEPDAGATAEKAAETPRKGGRRARRSSSGG